MRWKRRRLLWRSFRARRDLTKVVDRTSQIDDTAILIVGVLRNEITRLPYFLAYYRQLGVQHFLLIDNGSDDGSAEFLSAQEDVSLWTTGASYKNSRFGLDWMTRLQMLYAHNHWCLMVDVDEVFVVAGGDLRTLTENLDAAGRDAHGALMLDLYPKGPVDQQSYRPGQDPTEVLQWFDAGPFRAVRQYPLGNLWVQGGARERMFFADTPRRSPTLNKLPLVKWNRKFAYVNSTHSILPPRLNALYDGPGGTQPSGVLLHTKFLPEIVAKSVTEKTRGQHFHTAVDFDAYYDALIGAPDMWHSGSVRYEGGRQLEDLGLVREIETKPCK